MGSCVYCDGLTTNIVRGVATDFWACPDRDIVACQERLDRVAAQAQAESDALFVAQMQMATA